MVYDSNGNFVKAGDVLSFKRGVYSHIALAVDKDNAVHLTGNQGDFDALLGSSSGRCVAYVKLESIETIAAGCKFYVSNAIWKKSRYTREEVVKRAKVKVGEKKLYMLTTANCEHFVNELITGEASSQQVQTAVAYGLAGSAFTVGLVGILCYWLGNKTDDDEVKEKKVYA